MTTIGFIGLGHMGQPMVKNLLAAGYQVKVFDVNPEAIRSLEKSGAIATGSIAEVMQKTDTVFTMLQTSDQVSAVCLDKNGIFAHAEKNLLYIDSSSIEITTTRKLHEEAKRHDIAMLDAPVSGGVNGATAGALTIMVGGETACFQRAEPLLKKLGKKIVHAGNASNGQAAKICNNLILGISMIAVSEGFALCEKLGLDPKTFFEISSNASGQCWSMSQYCPSPGILEQAPSSHDYQPGFSARMMLKDLRLGQHAAESVNAAVPLAAEAAELYALYVSQGGAEMDFSGIFRMIAGK